MALACGLLYHALSTWAMERFTRDAECLKDHCCPVFRVHPGKTKPRKALIMHLKRAKDSSHRAWIHASYKEHFTMGGHPTVPEPRGVIEIQQRIREYWGDEAAERFNVHKYPHVAKTPTAASL